MTTVKEANERRLCLYCGAPNASLFRTTKGANPGRLLRLCDQCLRSGDWYQFGIVEREPLACEKTE